jgi:hypothetical protein
LVPLLRRDPGFVNQAGTKLANAVGPPVSRDAEERKHEALIVWDGHGQEPKWNVELSSRRLDYTTTLSFALEMVTERVVAAVGRQHPFAFGHFDHPIRNPRHAAS